MKKIVLLITFTLLSMSLFKESDVVIVPQESIRFRVIANSNSIEDTFAKEKVTESITEYIASISNTNDIEESRKNINNNISEIDKKISNTLKLISYNKDYNINYGTNYFPEKIYKGVKYSEGYYESLVVTIGEGEGDNYWCVLFPPLCMVEESNIGEEVEYKFLVSEIISKFKSINK